MKKNIDPQTAKLFEAVKTAYFRECSGIVRDNKELQPLTVDIMNQLLKGGIVNNMTIAEDVDRNKRIELMEGYSCSLASLPRIYKQVARLAGETCEKITVSPNQLEPYGFDWEIDWKEPSNKKLMAALKKYCPAPKKNDSRLMYPWKMGVYHDATRHCAVWSDGLVMMVAPWLYNPAAAGQCVDATGMPIKDYEGHPVKYPRWAAAVPDMSYKMAKKLNFEVYSVNAARVAEYASNVAAMVKGVKNSKQYFIAARYAADGGIVALSHSFAPFLSMVNDNIYFKNGSTAAVGYMGADGFILFMPSMPGYNAEEVAEEVARYADNKTIYADTENEIYIKNPVIKAQSDILPLPFLAVCPEEKIETPAADTAEVVETPAPAAAPCVALVVVPVADAEPQPEPAAAPVRDAADIEAELTAAVIRCHYSSMMAQAEPLPVVDTYDVETLSDNAAIIRCRRRGASCLIALTPRNANHYTVTSLKDGAIFTPQWSMPAARHYDDETIHPFVIWCMRDAIHDAITYFDTLPVVADAEPAAETVPMLPDPPAVVHVSGPVPPSPRRRRPAPRLRPIFRRLWRVAAVVVPLVVLAMLTASTAADNGHQTPAADAVAMTPAAALPVAVDADTLQVVELPPVTVTAPRTPSGQKTGRTPSGQKTAAAVADASPTDEPTADTPAGQKTDADGLPDTLQPDSQPHGLTICEGTAWAYTMMNWA